MTKKNDKRYVEKKMEWARRSFNYSQFDDLLKTDFGGDITDMYEYILESEEQFEEKFGAFATYPQVIMWGKKIGGCDDLNKYIDECMTGLS